jgi:hypothetical protein
METCEEQTFLGLEAEPQYSAQVSRASRVPWPGSEEAKKMTVGSGTQCSMLLDESSPLGAFSKILLGSSHWTNSEEYSYVWNRLDTRFALSAFQLTPSGQSTGDSECSLWRTPTGTEANGGGNPNDPREYGSMMRLRDQVKNQKLWPTPRALKNTGKDRADFSPSLLSAAKLWPTPTQRDWKSCSPGNQDNARPLSEVAGLTGFGSLNPEFVCQLMGYPASWTKLK